MKNYELRHKNCEGEAYKYDDLVLSTSWGPTYTLKELEKAKRKFDKEYPGVFYIKEVE